MQWRTPEYDKVFPLLKSISETELTVDCDHENYHTLTIFSCIIYRVALLLERSQLINHVTFKSTLKEGGRNSMIFSMFEYIEIPQI